MKRILKLLFGLCMVLASVAQTIVDPDAELGVDSVVLNEFHIYWDSVKISQVDTSLYIFDSTELSNDLSMAWSTHDYKIRFMSSCPYYETYTMLDDYEYYDDYLKSCTQSLQRDTLITKLYPGGDSIYKSHHIFSPIDTDLKKSPLYDQYSSFHMVSYGHGKYVILERHWIYQHGGQTSYGFCQCLYLERIE